MVHWGLNEREGRIMGRGGVGGGVCYRDSTVIFVIAYLSLFGIPICLTAKKQLCLV